MPETRDKCTWASGEHESISYQGMYVTGICLCEMAMSFSGCRKECARFIEWSVLSSLVWEAMCDLFVPLNACCMYQPETAFMKTSGFPACCAGPHVSITHCGSTGFLSFNVVFVRSSTANAKRTIAVHRNADVVYGEQDEVCHGGPSAEEVRARAEHRVGGESQPEHEQSPRGAVLRVPGIEAAPGGVEVDRRRQ